MAIVAQLSPAEAVALEAFVRGARERLGAHLLRIVLYGSRARGEGNESSDVDVALIVTPAGRERRSEVYDIAYDLSLEHGVQLAPLVIEAERLDELRRRERLFAAELDRDGVVL